MELTQKIEAILFHMGAPVAKNQLAKWLNIGQEEVGTALNDLEAKLQNQGINLVRKDDEVMLGTSPDASSLLEQITKEELSRDLGKAALETLTLVVYQGPISRAEIDYVRGVNSSFILRHLLVRGLIERIVDEKDARRFLYRPTFDLLQHLGLTKIEDLPEYAEVKKQVTEFLTNQQIEQQDDNN